MNEGINEQSHSDIPGWQELIAYVTDESTKSKEACYMAQGHICPKGQTLCLVWNGV